MRKIQLLFTLLILWLLPQSQPATPQAAAANVPKPTGAGWQQIQKLVPDLIEDEESLGRAVAFTDDTLVIANQAGDRVHVYTHPGAFWQEVGILQRSGAPILRPIAVDTDGETIVVGYEEAVYVYQKPAGGWQTMIETAVLTASDHELNDDFGVAVGVDGDTIVVGAPLDSYGQPTRVYGSAYVFVRPGSTWSNMTETAKLTADNAGSLDHFGISVGIAGDTIVIGSRGAEGSNTNAGGAYIFEKPGGGWVTTANDSAFLIDSDGVLGAGLGISVAISADANTVAVGEYRDEEFANQAGAVNVFVKPGGGWTDMNETAKLTPITPLEGENLGTSVDIWQNMIIAGADGSDDFLPGAAYLFVMPGGGWTDTHEAQRLLPNDGVAGDGFGTAVGIREDMIVVGAPGYETPSQFSGAAYLFSTTAVSFDHFVFLPMIIK